MNNASPPPRFRHTQSVFGAYWHKLREALYRSLTRRGAPIFLRGRDVISTDPLLGEMHEPALSGLIARLRDDAHADFLLDIGANVGLTSCQSGEGFGVVHMYEPNPYCCHILAVNAAITLGAGKFEIHPCGLGDAGKTVRLNIPRHNWGGAFVQDAGNAYDQRTLVDKDFLDHYSPENYLSVDVEIRDAREELSALFARLAGEGRRRGVVKIDVEGYEAVVLRGLAAALPADFDVYVIFESWDPEFPMDEILSRFGAPARAWRFVRRVPWKRRWPRVLKALSLLWRPVIVHEVVEGGKGAWSGDLVLHVAARGSTRDRARGGAGDGA